MVFESQGWELHLTVLSNQRMYLSRLYGNLMFF